MARPALSLTRPNLRTQLDGYRHLRNGWDGDSGIAPPENRIAAAERLLATLPCDLATPACGPAGDGEVGLYWDDPETGVYVDVDVWPEFDGTDRGRPMTLLAYQRGPTGPPRICGDFDEGHIPEGALEILRRIPTWITPETVAGRARTAHARDDRRGLQAAVTDILRFLSAGTLTDRRQDWRALALGLALNAYPHTARQGRVAFCLLTWPESAPPEFPGSWICADAHFPSATMIDPVTPVDLDG